MVPSRPLPCTRAAVRGGMETWPKESSTMAGPRAAMSASMSRSAITSSVFNSSMMSTRRYRTFLRARQFLISLLDVVLGEVVEVTPAAVSGLDGRHHRIRERLTGLAGRAGIPHRLAQVHQIIPERTHLRGLAHFAMPRYETVIGIVFQKALVGGDLLGRVGVDEVRQVVVPEEI